MKMLVKSLLVALTLGVLAGCATTTTVGRDGLPL